MALALSGYRLLGAGACAGRDIDKAECKGIATQHTGATFTTKASASKPGGCFYVNGSSGERFVFNTRVTPGTNCQATRQCVCADPSPSAAPSAQPSFIIEVLFIFFLIQELSVPIIHPHIQNKAFSKFQ